MVSRTSLTPSAHQLCSHRVGGASDNLGAGHGMCHAGFAHAQWDSSIRQQGCAYPQPSCHVVSVIVIAIVRRHCHVLSKHGDDADHLRCRSVNVVGNHYPRRPAGQYPGCCSSGSGGRHGSSTSPSSSASTTTTTTRLHPYQVSIC